MDPRTRRYFRFIVLVMVIGISASFPIFFRHNLTTQNCPNDDFLTPEDPPVDDPPLSSGVVFIQGPEVSHKVISPETEGAGNFTIYSFTPDKAVNFSLNISAYYEPINIEGILDDRYEAAAYYMEAEENWLLAFADIPIFEETEVPLLVGTGKNASSIVWQEIGTVNDTYGMAIAGNGSSIRIVYFEGDWLENGKAKFVNYFASDDGGDSWYNGTLLDCSDWENVHFSTISMACCQNTFECVWGMANLTSDAQDSDLTQHTTIWDTMDTGFGWSAASNMTLLEDSYANCPHIFYNTTNNNGTLFLYVNNISYLDPSLAQGVVYQLSSPSASVAMDYWLLTEEETNSEQPKIYCAYDSTDGLFYFVNNSIDADARGIRNATNWKSPTIGNPQFMVPEIEADSDSSNVFWLFAYKSPMSFAKFATKYDLLKTPGILDCDTPFLFQSFEGELESHETFSCVFNGTNSTGSTQGAQAYVFSLIVEHVMEGVEDSNLVIGVDNSLPSIRVTNSTNIISPFNSFGIQDDFQVDIQASKSGSATFRIEVPNPAVGVKNISTSAGGKVFPAIYGDGTTTFACYSETKSASSASLMVAKSNDGGLSWDPPRAIHNFYIDGGGIQRNRLYCKGNDVFIWCIYRVESQSDGVPYLFYSSDGGVTFVMHSLSEFIFTTCEDDSGVACWCVDSGGGFIYIKKSSDYGFTWSDFLVVPTAELDLELIDAAYDPISGNYSFVFGEASELGFLTAFEDGSQYTYWNNLSDGITPNPVSFGWKTNLDAVQRSETLSEWVITSISINPVSGSYWSSNLSYCTTVGNGIISSWKDLQVSGKNLTGTGFFGWDIHYPTNTSILFITSKDDFSTLEAVGTSSVIFGDEKNTDENNQISFIFSGVTGTGGILEEGQYSWTMEFRDDIGHTKKESGKLIIDRTDPELGPYASLYQSTNPLPVNQERIFIPVIDDHIDSAILYFSSSSDPIWHNKTMTRIPTGFGANFTETLPITSATTVYWKVVVNDTAGNSCELDNNGNLYSYSKGVFQLAKLEEEPTPTLFDDWTWRYVFLSGADHVEKVWVQKLYQDSPKAGAATIETTYLEPENEAGTIFSVAISHTLAYQSATYLFMYQNDEGKNFTIAEKTLSRPSIRIELDEITEGPIDLSVTSEINITASVPEYAQYISHVFVKYTLDDNQGTIIQNMTQLNLGRFTFSIGNFSDEVTLFRYNVIAVDIYGNEYNLTDNDSDITLTPALPEWEMSSTTQMLVLIIAFVVGIITGFVYSAIMNRRLEMNIAETARQVPDDLKIEGIKQAKKPDKKAKGKTLETRTTIPDTKGSGKGHGTLIITAIIFGGFVISAALSYYWLQWPEVSMLLFTGAMLANVFLWVLVTDHEVARALREEKGKMRGGLVLVVGITIFVTLVMIFVIGNTVAWWRVRVNDQSFSLGEIEIPRTLTTLAGTFFSSVILLTRVVSRDVARTSEQLQKAEQHNENPGLLIERRETAISKIMRGVGTKGIIFLGIIGFSIIFASDLSIYASQGMVIIVPFLIGAIITLIFASIKKKEGQIDKVEVLQDRITLCPHCHTQTALGGSFCENCGEALIYGTRVVNGKDCPHCHQANPDGVTHCRNCSRSLQNSE